VVAQEQPPLAALGQRRGAPQDVDDGLDVLLAQRHEDARHHREVERHVALVPVAEVRAHVLRPLVGLGQEHPPGVVAVDGAADLLDHPVGLGEVLAARSVALHEVGDGVEAEPVDPQVQPEAHDVEDLLDDPRVVEVEVRLVAEEAVPVEGAGDGVPGPVGLLGVV
jgi:hypothetical protein